MDICEQKILIAFVPFWNEPVLPAAPAEKPNRFLAFGYRQTPKIDGLLFLSFFLSSQSSVGFRQPDVISVMEERTNDGEIRKYSSWKSMGYFVEFGGV